MQNQNPPPKPDRPLEPDYAELGWGFSMFKYCRYCGTETEINEKFNGYDSETGNKIYRRFSKCPRLWCRIRNWFGV